MNEGGVWSLVWHRDGQVLDSSLEVLGEAHRIGRLMGEEVVAVVLGEDMPGSVEALGSRGASRLLFASAPGLRTYATGPHLTAMERLILQGSPRVIFVPGSSNGRDLGPRLAAHMGLGIVSECTYLRVDADGRLVATRPGYGGRIAQRVALGPAGIVIVPRGVFPPQSFESSGVLETECVRVDGLPEPDLVLTSTERLRSEDLTLEEAAVIVAGGAGMGGEEGFRSLSELAAMLGGRVGASRRATDLGWADRSALVGQTGTTVRPSLYMACGISGAPQHALGIRGSKTIVAVNSDPDAPIFGFADLGVLGDVSAVIPRLIAALARRLEGGRRP